MSDASKAVETMKDTCENQAKVVMADTTDAIIELMEKLKLYPLGANLNEAKRRGAMAVVAVTSLIQTLVANGVLGRVSDEQNLNK